ncbi:MAG: hypothetical protein LLG09_04805 [Negativicutes bacterium]|nr:hypothetical protein [Negativicutes bacterium]
MKKTTRILLVITMILAVSSGAFFVFAASSYSTPAEIVAGLTGRSLESVIAEHEATGENYGQIAAAAGLRDEFISEMALLRQDKIAAKVASGEITQAQADEILSLLAARRVLGNGLAARISQKLGLGRGMMNGFGQNIEVLKEKIAAKVASGDLTQNQADQILALIADRQANFADGNPGTANRWRMGMRADLRQKIANFQNNKTNR